MSTSITHDSGMMSRLLGCSSGATGYGEVCGRLMIDAIIMDDPEGLLNEVVVAMKARRGDNPVTE